MLDTNATYRAFVAGSGAPFTFIPCLQMRFREKLYSAMQRFPFYPSPKGKCHAAKVALYLILLACAFLMPTMVRAHGDVHEQILKITEKIKLEPDNAQLHLRRGELHRIHMDWDTAEADYTRAAQLDPSMDGVELARGTMLLEAGRPQEAKDALDGFLKHNPDHIRGLVVRARALTAVDRNLDAERDYTRAISKMRRPLPEYYFERAKALAAEDEEHVDRALAGLDEGIKKLGPVVTLQLCAIDLELTVGRHDAALARLDAIMKQSARKERWLLRRGEILLEAGRVTEASEALKRGLNAIGALNPSRRKTQTTKELKKRLTTALERAESQTHP